MTQENKQPPEQARASEEGLLESGSLRTAMHTTLPREALNETQKRALLDPVAQSAYYDPVTHLPNRTLFLDRLTQALAQAPREQHPVGLLFIDLDRFKMVNDSMGHQAGDAVLREVADRIQSGLRQMDTVARLGGDEFAVLMPVITDVTRMRSIAEKLISSISERYELDEGVAEIGASIGIATYPSYGERVPEKPESSLQERANRLLYQADQAMYLAKSAGRGQVKVYDALLNAQIHRRGQLERRLWQAYEHETLHLQFDPVWHLPSGKMDGFSTRWSDEGVDLHGKTVSEALKEVDNSLLTERLGRKKIEMALPLFAHWQQMGVTQKMALTLPRAVLVRPDFLTWFTAQLHQYEVEPEGVILELDESSFATSREGIMPQVTALSELGMGITLDNVGEGAFPLSILKSSAIDNVKISGVLVQQMLLDPASMRLVEGLVQLSLALGKVVIAEGVVTKEEAGTLQDLGVALAQGALLCEPLSQEALEAMLLSTLHQGLNTTTWSLPIEGEEFELD